MSVLVLFQKNWEVRADLETFKRDGITDLTSEAQMALAGNAEYEKKSVRTVLKSVW